MIWVISLGFIVVGCCRIDFPFLVKDNRFVRIVSFIVLIAVCLMFTGLSSYATVTPPEKPAKSCCEECNKRNESGKSDHCSTPTCPMFLCLSMNIVTPFMPSIQTTSVFVTQIGTEFYVLTPAKSVFHPPVVS